MKKYVNELKYEVSEVFFNFLKDKDLGKLKTRLDRYIVYCVEMYGFGGELWFKFGEDDTLCTTVGEIYHTLSLPENHKNHQFLLEQFRLVTGDIDPDHEIQPYFSYEENVRGE